MQLVCLDLEGVLVPEIWIAFAEATGVNGLRMTTRDIADYDELMQHRIRLLARHGFRLRDIQQVIEGIEPLPGARGFLDELRENTQVVILSDTFVEFATPIMRKLGWPTLLCNELVVNDEGCIVDFRLRHANGKEHAVSSFQSMGLTVTAVGDSYNDLPMLRRADSAALFRPPQRVREEQPDLPTFDRYDGLLAFILDSEPAVDRGSR